MQPSICPLMQPRVDKHDQVKKTKLSSLKIRAFHIFGKKLLATPRSMVRKLDMIWPTIKGLVYDSKQHHLLI